MTLLICLQLLKAIFGTNVSGQWESPDQNSSRLFSKNRPTRSTTRVTMSLKHGIYHSCLNSPYTQFTQSLAGATFRANVHGSDQEEAVGYVGTVCSHFSKLCFFLLVDYLVTGWTVCLKVLVKLLEQNRWLATQVLLTFCLRQNGKFWCFCF